MKKEIIIGTRKSELALCQTRYISKMIQQNFPDLHIKEERLLSKGDRILDVPLAKIGGKGLFTKELENALLEGKIDCAVHSLKDMPVKLPQGLIIAAVSERFDARDAFISTKYKDLNDLPLGASIGTSSLRRKAQLLKKRPDLKIIDLRGNINTRLQKLQDGQYDAIILAVAGLKRLGLHKHITSFISLDDVLCAAGQGILAIETRKDHTEMLDILKTIQNTPSFYAMQAERAFLNYLEGGCQAPMAVHATVQEDVIIIEGLIASLDGKIIYREKMKDSPTKASELGEKLAKKILKQGGLTLLQSMGFLQDKKKQDLIF